jgi:hypothetical protein
LRRYDHLTLRRRPSHQAAPTLPPPRPKPEKTHHHGDAKGSPVDAAGTVVLEAAVDGRAPL